MAAYSSSRHHLPPQYNYTSYHQASLYPHLYSSSTYSLPLSRNHSRSHRSRSHSSSRRRSDYAMPTYVVSNGSGHRSSSRYRDSQPRSSSRSYQYASSGYGSQPVVYTSSNNNVYPRDYAYSDSGRRYRSSSVGRGGTQYYYPPGNRSSYSHPPQYYTTSTSGRRRSYSTSHHRTPQVIDARHSTSSGRRPSVSYVSTVSKYLCFAALISFAG